MQTITVTRKIDKANNVASFLIDSHEIAVVKPNLSLPTGYYVGRVRGFGDVFAYNQGFGDSVNNVTMFIRNTFSHEFGIEVKFVD